MFNFALNVQELICTTIHYNPSARPHTTEKLIEKILIFKCRYVFSKKHLIYTNVKIFMKKSHKLTFF